jgi:4-hydroxy-3-methylbut-2-en-1-yl diphosphate synthase IspG/GcpE
MKFQKCSERSAELHSAVSQICNLRRWRNTKAVRAAGRFAECNSAIRQIKNLRYEVLVPRHALLHFQSSGAAHSRALTGLFTT